MFFYSAFFEFSVLLLIFNKLKIEYNELNLARLDPMEYKY